MDNKKLIISRCSDSDSNIYKNALMWDPKNPYPNKEMNTHLYLSFIYVVSSYDYFNIIAVFGHREHWHNEIKQKKKKNNKKYELYESK